MELLCGDTILLGKNYAIDMIQTSLAQAHVLEKTTLKEIQKWQVHWQNITLVHTTQTCATYIEFITNELQPDFLEMPFHEHSAESR